MSGACLLMQYLVSLLVLQLSRCKNELVDLSRLCSCCDVANSTCIYFKCLGLSMSVNQTMPDHILLLVSHRASNTAYVKAHWIAGECSS